jgi:hypothetical protein
MAPLSTTAASSTVAHADEGVVLHLAGVQQRPVTDRDIASTIAIRPRAAT